MKMSTRVLRSSRSPRTQHHGGSLPLSFTDSLRGYTHPIHERDGYICVYCCWDGRLWPNWLYLSRDHLLPKGHPQREQEEFVVTACRFCNEVHNRTTFEVEGKSPDEIISVKRQAVLERRAEYKDFWDQKVCKSGRPIASD